MVRPFSFFMLLLHRLKFVFNRVRLIICPVMSVIDIEKFRIELGKLKISCT